MVTPTRPEIHRPTLDALTARSCHNPDSSAMDSSTDAQRRARAVDAAQGPLPRNSHKGMTKIIQGACLSKTKALSASKSVLMRVPSRSTNKGTDWVVSEVIMWPGQQ